MLRQTEAYMKVKENYIPREVAGEYLLIPVGEAALKTKGLISMTESGYLLFCKLQQSTTRGELLQCILGEYDVSDAQAEADIEEFLQQMRSLDMLEEDEA